MGERLPGETVDDGVTISKFSVETQGSRTGVRTESQDPVSYADTDSQWKEPGKRSRGTCDGLVTEYSSVPTPKRQEGCGGRTGKKLTPNGEEGYSVHLVSSPGSRQRQKDVSKVTKLTVRRCKTS